MTATLFTATAEHDCHFKHCPKKNTIAVGEKAVKTTSRQSSSGGSWTTTVYYHEECYQARPGRGKK